MHFLLVAVYYLKTNLKSIRIPSNVMVENDAFRVCMDLTSVSISSNVKMIGETAFDHCRNLSTITIISTKVELNNPLLSDFRLKTSSLNSLSGK